METIYINKDIKNKLINQLAKFYISSDMYDKYGITWKRVHLFHGPPGSGKTSTVLALASIFGKNICKLTLTPDLNSQHIELLFQSIPEESFLLLEDVDALFTERTSKTAIDFSTLLNCMDGLTTKRGLVVFMTTNHVTKLDKAFIRPGRVDMCIEFNLPGKDELHEALKVLGEKYEHEHEEFLKRHTTDMSIAVLQKHLFECMMEEKKSILF
jgi:SpoVK/Ycf46/Vps4 family AAA+-type ATPase